MKIGIDIDEVLVEFVEGYLEIYKFKFWKEFSKKNLYSYNLWEPLGISKEESIQLAFDFYKSNKFDNIKLVKLAKESIYKLLENHEIIFITSRPELVREKTEDFLSRIFLDKKFKIVFSDDFFGGNKKKSFFCIKLGIFIILEDNRDYALDCAKMGIKVILFDKPWNKDFIKHENIFKVNNWKEALAKIKEIENALAKNKIVF